MNIPLVSVCSLAYQHASFIRQCMDGVLMQKTSFPIEYIIHDDASTDGTADIIREYEARYPEIIKAIYQTENQYSTIGAKVLPEYLFPHVRGKYIALCEGDDYWTDPYKLQKQVDFLEVNDDFSICFHAMSVKNEHENTIVDDYITWEVPDVTEIYDLAQGNYMHTPSVVFRKNEEVFKAFAALGDLPVGDYVLHLLNAQYGKIKKLPDRMAVYRAGVGIWSTAQPRYSSPLWLALLEKLILFFAEDQKVTHILKQQYGNALFNTYSMYEYGKDFDNAKALFTKLCINYPEFVYDKFKDRERELHAIKNTKIYRIGRFLLKPFPALRKLINRPLPCI